MPNIYKHQQAPETNMRSTAIVDLEPLSNHLNCPPSTRGMEHDSGASSADLPEDVFRLICWWAVQDSTQDAKGDCCNLALLCSQAKSIVEPMIYADIDLRSPVVCELLNRTIAHHPQKPSNFFACAVKVIRVTFTPILDSDVDAIKCVLDACTGINGYHNRKTVQAGLDKSYRCLVDHVPPTQHLTLGAWSIPRRQRDFCHTIFANVTHLRMFFRSQECIWVWSSIRSLEHLTHLFLRLPITQDIQPLFEFCKASSKLRLIVLARLYPNLPPLGREVQQFSEVDIRLVISYRWPNWLDLPQDLPEELEWIKQYAIPSHRIYERNLSLMWEEGEAKVEARRRGLVEWPPKPSTVG